MDLAESWDHLPMGHRVSGRVGIIWGFDSFVSINVEWYLSCGRGMHWQICYSIWNSAPWLSHKCRNRRQRVGFMCRRDVEHFWRCSLTHQSTQRDGAVVGEGATAKPAKAAVFRYGTKLNNVCLISVNYAARIQLKTNRSQAEPQAAPRAEPQAASSRCGAGPAPTNIGDM